MLSARYRNLYKRVPEQFYSKLENFDLKTLEHLARLPLPMDFKIDFYGGWFIKNGRMFVLSRRYPTQVIRPYLVNIGQTDIYRAALKSGNVLQSYKQPEIRPIFNTGTKAPKILEIIIDPSGINDKMMYERLKNVCRFYDPFFQDLWFDIKRPVYKDDVLFGFNIKRFRKLEFVLLELTNMRSTTFKEVEQNV